MQIKNKNIKNIADHLDKRHGEKGTETSTNFEEYLATIKLIRQLQKLWLLKLQG